MPKLLFITLTISALIAAGSIVAYNLQEKPEQETTSLSATTHRSHKPRATARHQTSKWSALTDKSQPLEFRLALARQIDNNLSPEDTDQLFAALHYRPAAHNRETWWVIMNEIMEQMRRKGVAPDRYSKELISLLENPSQPEVVRDYAAQHLSLWIVPSTNGAPSEPSTETRDQALSAIAATITDPSIAHSSIPGTALMALTTISMDLAPEVTAPIWAKLDPAMTSMLNGETNVPLSSKTTIIQSVAIRGSENHLPLIQTMARDEQIDPSLRLSSIAALGIYQSTTDRDYLTTIAQGSTRYRYAAQSALKKLPK